MHNSKDSTNPYPLSLKSGEYFPADTGTTLKNLIAQYEASGYLSIEVSFRDLVPWVYGGTRATHYLHSYPAKLLPQIVHFFLANEIFCPSDGAVLDPFSGSGTVALETILSGRDAYYCDINPFARMLTKAKTTPLPMHDLEREFDNVNKLYNQINLSTIPDVVNLGYWYNEKTAANLSKLKSAINMVADEEIQHFLKICFSSVARKLSRANPKFSVPVRAKVDGELIDVIADEEHVWASFDQAMTKAKRQIEDLSIASKLGNVFCASHDVLNLEESWPSCQKKFGEIDLVITSPPYAGAQKYVRATSLSLGWLDHVKSSELTKIESKTLGREHLPKADVINRKSSTIDAADEMIFEIAKENSTRAAIVSIFLNEMNIAAKNIMKSLKPGGYAVIVMADNTVCGKHFPTTKFTSKLFENSGGKKVLELKDRIVSRSLQTKRASKASNISHETVMVFKKV